MKSANCCSRNFEWGGKLVSSADINNVQGHKKQLKLVNKESNVVDCETENLCDFNVKQSGRAIEFFFLKSDLIVCKKKKRGEFSKKYPCEL